MLTPDAILERLKGIRYPGFSRDVVSFGVVKDIEVGSEGVTIHLAPTTANEDVVNAIVTAVNEAVTTMPGMTGTVQIVRQQAAPGRGVRGKQPIPGVQAILAVASGKGGVGKSTVAANLALALATLRPRIGLMDADVYGPSVPLMLGITEQSQAGEDRRLTPVDVHGIKAISMGMFVPDGTPIIWRGPMLTKLVTEFLRNTTWGDLDILVIDLPPGTGDVQLTLTQQVPITGGVVVTTPQDVALADVRRGIQMFRQVDAPVLGIIENMSVHVCSGCGAETHLFGDGGGTAMATEFGVPLLGAVPIVRDLREAADRGTPLVAAQPSHPVSRTFREIAERVLLGLAEAERAAKRPSLAIVN